MDNIQTIIEKVYQRYFDFTDEIFKEEFGLGSEILRISKGRKPFPYLKSIYSEFLYSKGVPPTIISKGIGLHISNISVYHRNYKDSYQYNTEFRELADRFYKRLKEKENGVQMAND